MTNLTLTQAPAVVPTVVPAPSFNSFIDHVRKEECRNIDIYTRDIVAHPSNAPKGFLAFDIEGQTYEADEQTVGGIVRQFIPGGGSSYIFKCDPELAAYNINAWIAKKIARAEKHNKDYFVRLKEGVNGSPDVLRAVLSDRYNQVDNLELLENIAEGLDGFTVQQTYMTNHTMHLRLLSPKTYDVSTAKKGDIVQVGLHIANSETGAGSVRLAQIQNRLICTNGMVVADALGRMSLSHIRDAAEILELYHNALNAAKTNLSNHDSVIRKLVQSHDNTFDPTMAAEIVAYIGKQYGWNKKFNELVTTQVYLEEQSHFGLIQAITAVAKSYQGDDRLVLESRAYNLLETNFDKVKAAAVAFSKN